MKINIKQGLRRVALVSIGIFEIFILFIAWFDYNHEIIPLFWCVVTGFILYGLYLLAEKIIIWIIKGFKGE